MLLNCHILSSIALMLKHLHRSVPRQGFFGGGVKGGKDEETFKTIQSIRKFIHFSKITTFSLAENSFSGKKNFQKEDIWKISWIFSKNYFQNGNFSFFKGWTHRYREISDNFYFLVEKFIKISKKWKRSRRDEKS